MIYVLHSANLPSVTILLRFFHRHRTHFLTDEMRLKKSAVDAFWKIYLSGAKRLQQCFKNWKFSLYDRLNLFAVSSLFIDEMLEHAFILRSNTSYNQYYLVRSALLVIMPVTLAVIDFTSITPRTIQWDVTQKVLCTSSFIGHYCWPVPRLLSSTAPLGILIIYSIVWKENCARAKFNFWRLNQWSVDKQTIELHTEKEFDNGYLNI